ncbi:hypothetical protein FOZ62_021459, partial [Perkinsus olseni]
DGNEARHLLHANELARMRREGISLPLNHDGTADLAELESVGPPPKPRYFRAGSIIPKKDTYRSSSKLMYKDTYTLYVYIDPKSFSAGGYAYLDDTISYNSTHEDKHNFWKLTYVASLSATFDNGDLKVSPGEGSGHYSICIQRVVLIGLADQLHT